MGFETETGPRDLPCLGNVGALGSLLVHRPVHEVIAVHGGASPWLKDIVEVCDYFRITLRIVPEDLVFGQRRDLELIYHSDPLRLPEIVLRPKNLDSTALFFKRLIDIVVSSASLVLLTPLFLLIAAAIKITTPRLPVFYRWQVVGYNGRRFTGYKFTSMDADAESRKAELMSRNEMQGPVFKIRNDPRVTWLGRYLRKFSLNELPQLWSVLKGDMSLVGPRPAFPAELERYEIWQKRKLCVRPGITCLWQVRGRNKVSRFDDWVRMDLEVHRPMVAVARFADPRANGLGRRRRHWIVVIHGGMGMSVEKIELPRSPVRRGDPGRHHSRPDDLFLAARIFISIRAAGARGRVRRAGARPQGADPLD